MTQQVNFNPVQPIAKPKTAQPAKKLSNSDDHSFQSVLEKTAVQEPKNQSSANIEKKSITADVSEQKAEKNQSQVDSIAASTVLAPEMNPIFLPTPVLQMNGNADGVNAIPSLQFVQAETAEAIAAQASMQSTVQNAVPLATNIEQNTALQNQTVQSTQQKPLQVAEQVTAENMVTEQSQSMTAPTDVKSVTSEPVQSSASAQKTEYVQDRFSDTNLQNRKNPEVSHAQKSDVQPQKSTDIAKPNIPLKAHSSDEQPIEQLSKKSVIELKSGDGKETQPDSSLNQVQDMAKLYHSGNVVIKVSDTSSKSTLSPTHQVAENILQNYSNGKQEFQMDLFPKDLGKVTVKLASEHGMLTVELIAANPKTQSLLLSGTGEIKSILQETMNQPVQIANSGSQKQWYEQQQNSPDQSNPHQQEQHHPKHQTSFFQEDDDSISTADFISVMQQISSKAYQI